MYLANLTDKLTFNTSWIPVIGITSILPVDCKLKILIETSTLL